MDNFTSFSGKIGWGQIHFAVPLRALGLVFDFGEVYDPTMEGMRDGLFSTAFSSIYYDFGWFGPAITFLFGYAATRLHAMAMREPHCWILLYGTVAFSCALAFVESQLLSGYFASAVWSFLLFALGASFWNSLNS